MSAGLAQVLRTFGPAYLREHALTSLQARVWRNVLACRTQALGGRVQQCDNCGRQQPWFNAWVVYAKTPLAGPAQVLDYLARYTHRIAILNERIEAVEAGGVRLRVRDNERCGTTTVRIEGVEFIRRFMTHVVPRGFKRVRHYGLLVSGHKAKRLSQARAAPALPQPSAAACGKRSANPSIAEPPKLRTLRGCDGRTQRGEDGQSRDGAPPGTGGGISSIGAEGHGVVAGQWRATAHAGELVRACATLASTA